MNIASDLLQRLDAAGVTVTVDGPDLVLRPGDRVPAELNLGGKLMSKKAKPTTTTDQPSQGLMAQARESLAAFECQRDEVLKRKEAHERDMAEAIESGNLAAARRDATTDPGVWDEATSEIEGLETVVARTTVLIENLAVEADRVGDQANDVKVELRKLRDEVVKLQGEVHSLRRSLKINDSLNLKFWKSQIEAYRDHAARNEARLIEINGPEVAGE